MTAPPQSETSALAGEVRPVELISAARHPCDGDAPAELLQKDAPIEPLRCDRLDRTLGAPRVTHLREECLRVLAFAIDPVPLDQSLDRRAPRRLQPGCLDQAAPGALLEMDLAR